MHASLDCTRLSHSVSLIANKPDNHVDVEHADGGQRRILGANHKGAENGETLRQVGRHVQNHDLAQIVPDAAALCICMSECVGSGSQI